MKVNKRYIIGLFLLVTLLLSACSDRNRPRAVSLPISDTTEIGSAMPEIIAANEERVVFWGEFGLFVVDSTTGDLQGSVDLSRIESNHYKGCNHMTGDVVTKFWMSESGKSVYFLNTGYGVSNKGKGPQPHALHLEDMTLDKYLSEELNVMPPLPSISFEYVGGEPEGYTSNLVVDEAGIAYYLYASDWYVNKLILVRQNVTTNETQEMALFA